MEKKQLIQLWMAEGFLQMDFGNDQMEIGYQYINSLLQTCLLQEVIDEDGESRCVGMHDLAGLISKSKNDHVRCGKPQDHSLVVHSFPLEKEQKHSWKFLGHHYF